MSALLDAVDVLYRGVVSEPGAWNDRRLEDWSETLGEFSELDRASAKYIRRVMTAARKLRAFWSEHPVDEGIDWRSRVDLALGNRAWRPVLDLATYLLSIDPSPEVFERTSILFRTVNHEQFIDGITYEEWIEN
ncbi:MAG: hypothetical protein M3132_07550 [Actinomycetia bacterium]|nr:hypothetical protein [Actinomycetes bacterium]